MPRITRFIITLLAVCILVISCKPDTQRVNHNYWNDIKKAFDEYLKTVK